MPSNPFHTPSAARVTFAGDRCPAIIARNIAPHIFSAMRTGDIPPHVFACYNGDSRDVHCPTLGTFDVLNDTGEHIATFF